MRPHELILVAALSVAPAPVGADVQWVCRADDRRRPATEAAATDEDIAAAVRAAVLAYRPYSMFDAVGFEVRDGAVTLSGSVLDRQRRADIAARVASLPAVREVRNTMRVLGDSFAEDKLRRRVAKAVYGSPGFRKRAHEAHPLHIVVDGTAVTLRGCVVDETERAALLAAAREAAGGDVEDGLEIDPPR